MTCYEMARKIMDRIREQMCYSERKSRIYKGVAFYDDPSNNSEFFNLSYDGIKVHASLGVISRITIANPRGIVHFNLRLWLMQLDRMVSKYCSTDT